MIANAKSPVEVTSNGIRINEKKWSWPEVAVVSPARVSFSKKVRIAVEMRPVRAAILVKFTLQGESTLDTLEYIEIASKIRDFVGREYPAVRVQMPGTSPPRGFDVLP